MHRSVAGRLGGGGDNKSVYYFDVLVVSSSCFLRFLRVLEVNSSYLLPYYRYDTTVVLLFVFTRDTNKTPARASEHVETP